MDALMDVLNLHVQADLAGPMLWVSLVFIGLGVGVLTGLFGVGGGFLAVPAMNILLGIPYEIAIGSSLNFIVGTSIAGLGKHIRAKHVEGKTVFVLAIGSMVGAVLGDMLQDVMIVHLARGDEVTFDNIMTGLFIVLLLLTAWVVFAGPKEHHTGLSPMQRLGVGPRVDLPGAGLLGVSLPGMILTGLGVGVVTGIFGIGGGVLFVPILLLLVGLSAHQAVGTSLGVVLLASIAGTIKKGYAGKVSLSVAMALLLGSAIGVQLGAWLCVKLHANKLRRAFAGIVLISAMLMAASLAKDLITQSSP